MLGFAIAFANGFEDCFICFTVFVACSFTRIACIQFQLSAHAETIRRCLKWAPWGDTLACAWLNTTHYGKPRQPWWEHFVEQRRVSISAGQSTQSGSAYGQGICKWSQYKCGSHYRLHVASGENHRHTISLHRGDEASVQVQVHVGQVGRGASVHHYLIEHLYKQITHSLAQRSNMAGHVLKVLSAITPPQQLDSMRKWLLERKRKQSNKKDSSQA